MSENELNLDFHFAGVYDTCEHPDLKNCKDGTIVILKNNSEWIKFDNRWKLLSVSNKSLEEEKIERDMRGKYL